MFVCLCVCLQNGPINKDQYVELPGVSKPAVLCTRLVSWRLNDFLAGCDVYVGGKVRVLELMRFFYLKHSGSKINFVL